MSTLRATNIKGRNNGVAPAMPDGVVVTGVVTATSFRGDATGLTGTPDITVRNITGVGMTLSGTLNYEDVTNIDSIGIITARSNVSIADSIIHTGDTDTSIRFPAADTFTVETGGSEALRVDSSQRLLLGTNSSGGPYAGDSNNIFQIKAGNTAKIVVHRETEDAYGGNLRLGKSRSSTNTIDNNDEVGIIEFFGHDSTDTNSRLAHIGCYAEADGATNDTPGRLVFATTADGAQSPTERFRITSNGGIHLNNGELLERANVTAGKLSDNANIDLENGMVHLFTTAESTTSTPNLRINSSTSLNSVMAIGDTIAVTIITTAAAAGYSAQLTIDGSAVTENWVGGSAPSSGGSSGVDIYNYTIIKTADATFTVVANYTATS